MGGIVISIASVFCLIQLKILQMTIDYKIITFVTLGICMYSSFCVIVDLEGVKNKSEDIFWKKIFQNGMKMAKGKIFNMVNIIFLSYIGIAMLFLNIKVITKEMIYIAISGSMGMIAAFLITIFLYAIFNHQKTIYKTISNNKLNGERSLKL